MYYDGIAPQIAPGKHTNRAATLTPYPEGWVSKLSVVRTNESLVRSTGVAGTDRLDLMGVHPSAALDQLVEDLSYLCRVALDACERSQSLLAIIRPFLSRTTWAEAIEIAQRGRCALPGETRQVTILRLDIANFTDLMDSHSLDQVLSALNAYLDTMTQIVYRHHGDVNKYLGDGFLCVFADADDAVQAGRAMQQAAADFNRRQSDRGGLVFPTRIGIASGPIATVSLGSHDRQDRTVIGIPINLAERLQKKAPPGQVWLSQATFDRLRDQSGCRCVGSVEIKGLQEPVVVYEKH
jgi:class 3 adenylate cyclase